MTKKRLRRLLTSYWNGNISSQEYEELMNFLSEHPDNTEMEAVMDEIAEWTGRGQPINIPTWEMYADIIGDNRYKKSLARQQDRRRMWQKWPFAAAIAAGIMLSLLFYFWQRTEHELVARSAGDVGIPASVSTVLPGHKQATLTLADGSTIPLDSLEGRVVQTMDGVRLSIKAGRLIYDMDKVVAKPIMNTISTPLGGEYGVTLPDGTQVWLNAASSITYPIMFTENERTVTISGEVYFEVKRFKDMAFVVTAGDTRIKVLGTHFNVSAYEDEPSVRTTLLEGSVQVQKGRESRLLNPGQQAETWPNQDKITIRKVDVEEATAWKNGYFLFNNEPVADAMKKIGRWYNVDIHYEGNIPQKGLDGTISKMEDIRQLLKALEITGTARFELKERRIIVTE
ncbi:FecR protein [Parapedobacter composti]|uniref:FecR protein n=1 Tax=Parapedobacter composti TaxID=623281 RepID=A0A1I1E0N9_9SPHI|nr:FecR family protein [Parapedobacter composti]SFB80741.1 FecR protein [Parapedobacter composti]